MLRRFASGMVLIATLASTGCCCYRPFLWRHRCGGEGGCCESPCTSCCGASPVVGLPGPGPIAPIPADPTPLRVPPGMGR